MEPFIYMVVSQPVVGSVDRGEMVGIYPHRQRPIASYRAQLYAFQTRDSEHCSVILLFNIWLSHSGVNFKTPLGEPSKMAGKNYLRPIISPHIQHPTEHSWLFSRLSLGEPTVHLLVYFLTYCQISTTQKKVSVIFKSCIVLLFFFGSL